MTEETEAKKPDNAIEKRERDPRLAIPLSASGGLAPRNYGELIDFARMVAQSGMVPKAYEGNIGAVLVAVQMGAELGLAPMTAIRSICVINGMPSVWGDGMLALVVSHRDCEDVIETLEGMVATCTVKRRGRSPVTRTFSWDDARAAGLDQKKGPWQSYPKRMLQMRARGFALRDAFPDVLRGVRSTEEALDSSVDMGRADYIEPTPGPEINPATAIPPAGVSHFGGKRPNGNVSREAPQGSAQAPGTEPPEPQVESPPAGAASASLGPLNPGQEGDRTPMGYQRGGAADEPPEEEEPPPPSQAELEASGQQKLAGGRF